MNCLMLEYFIESAGRKAVVCTSFAGELFVGPTTGWAENRNFFLHSVVIKMTATVFIRTTSATLNADRTLSLPSSIQCGDIVRSAFNGALVEYVRYV